MILITGASGFIGTSFCKLLRSKNIEYRAAVRAASDEMEHSTGDLNTFGDWDRLLSGVDIVVHAAAKAHDMSGRPELSQIYRNTNYEFTVRFANEAKKRGVRKFIFLSTIKVNGEESFEEPFQADDPPNPQDEYAHSKYMAEQALRILHTPEFFEVVIIRPCLVYGPGVKANFQQLINLVQRGLPLPFAGIHNRRSFVSLDNLNNLILEAVRNPRSAGQIFLASDGQDLSLPELITEIGKALNIKPRIFYVPRFALKWLLFLLKRKEMARRLFGNLQADISKNKDVLQWTPPYKVSTSLKNMISLNL